MMNDGRQDRADEQVRKREKLLFFSLNIQRLHSISCHKLIKPIRYGFNDVAEIIEEELKAKHSQNPTNSHTCINKHTHARSFYNSVYIEKSRKHM